uniref:Uncharacterized protein n=1 Tax=Romanomermis culicivorax TaxID=13658 RepID=A0A915JAR7_ROMCU
MKDISITWLYPETRRKPYCVNASLIMNTQMTFALWEIIQKLMNQTSNST